MIVVKRAVEKELNKLNVNIKSYEEDIKCLLERLKEIRILTREMKLERKELLEFLENIDECVMKKDSPLEGQLELFDVEGGKVLKEYVNKIEGSNMYGKYVDKIDLNKEYPCKVDSERE